MGDVGKGACMDQDRGLLQGLRGGGTAGRQVLGPDGEAIKIGLESP